MGTEDNVAKFRRLIERGFTGGDTSVVDEVMSPTCVEHQRGLPPGSAGAKGAISTLHSWFSDFELTIHDLAVDGEMIWSRNVGRGINTGSIMGRPPTGKSIEIDVVDIVRFEGGLIVEHWGVPDQLGMMQQLELMPARPAPVAS